MLKHGIIVKRHHSSSFGTNSSKEEEKMIYIDKNEKLFIIRGVENK